MRYLFTIILFTGFASLLNAQFSNFNTHRNWSLNKQEVRFGIGATQFLSDLGGRDQLGSHYTPFDLDKQSYRINLELGFRYRFHPYWATTTSVHIGALRASDQFTTEPYRNNRNLSVTTYFLEASQRVDYIFYANEKVGKRYNVPGLKGLRDRNTQLYGFVGIGLLAYAPTAFNGHRVFLRPLCTEGQGLPNGPEAYGVFTASVPFGVGARMGISRMWRIGVEFSYVKTFSDYLDDASGVYYDKAKLSQLKGPEAVYFSDPSISKSGIFKSQTLTGAQRGNNTQNDAYFYMNFVVTRNVTYKSYHRHMKHVRFKKGRYKF